MVSFCCVWFLKTIVTEHKTQTKPVNAYRYTIKPTCISHESYFLSSDDNYMPLYSVQMTLLILVPSGFHLQINLAIKSLSQTKFFHHLLINENPTMRLNIHICIYVYLQFQQLHAVKLVKICIHRSWTYVKECEFCMLYNDIVCFSVCILHRSDSFKIKTS